MTSSSDVNTLGREKQHYSQELKEKSIFSSDIGDKMGLTTDKENDDTRYLQPRKNREFCGVHGSKTPGKDGSRKNSSGDILQRKCTASKTSTCDPSTDVLRTKEQVDSFSISYDLKPNENELLEKNGNNVESTLEVQEATENTLLRNTKDMNDISKLSDDTLTMGESQHSSNVNKQSENKSDNSTQNEMNINRSNVTERRKKDNDQYNVEEQESSRSSTDRQLLPDILSTVHKSTPSSANTTHKYQSVDDKLFGFASKSNPTNGKVFKYSGQLSTPSSWKSDAFGDSEMEFRNETSLQSLRANQSIYKLAFDENITDQSSSRSPSPVDPETQVPSSLTNDEILIHEADSGSDAGSEDVELIAHRYESETFLNENKHFYVNKLSLAVELLRTQETLPYDAQFRRVSGDGVQNNLSDPNANFEVNLGFEEDSFCLNRIHGSSNNYDSSHENGVISQSPSNTYSKNAGAFCGNKNSLKESCEEAEEVIAEIDNDRDNTESVRAGHHRFQVQFRHYFTPRVALVNPCLCCCIM